MNLLRCDECCNVLDGIDDGVVYECSEEVYNKTFIEHICKVCLDYRDDLILVSKGNYYNLVEFKKDEYDKKSC